MRLKSESISFLKEQLRSQRWYMVVVTLVLFAMGPANTLRKLGYENKNLDVKYFLERYGQMYVRSDGILTSETYMFMLIALVAGILISVMTYSYLHYHNQVSFYYSVPIKRTQVFDCKAIASFLSFNIPMVLMMVLTGGVLASQGILNKYNSVGLLVVIFLNVISFALGYYIAAISMLVTGRVLIGVLGTGVFIGYFPSIVSLMTGYFSTFFNTYISSGTVPNNAWRYVFNLSPIALYSSFEWKSIVCYMVVVMSVIALMVLARYLVNIRPSEAAEKPMAYKVVADVVKIAISIPVGLCLGLFLASTTYQPTAWFYLGILFGVIVMYILIQLFYAVELKRIFQQKLQILAIIGTSLIIGSIFFFDLLGYDNYIPSYNNISDINVCFDEVYDGNYLYPFRNEDAETIHMGKNEEMYQFIQDAVESYDECVEQEDYIHTTYFVVDYRLNSGRRITRGYMAKMEDIEKSAESLWKNEAFLDLNYQIRNLENESIKHLDFSSQLLEREQFDFGNNPEENAEFVAALQQDYMELDGLAIMKENPVAAVGIESGGYGYNYMRADIYPNCTHAIEYLKGKGIDLTKKMKASDVKELYIAPSQNELNSIYEYGSVGSAIQNGYEMKVVTDQEEIEKLLPKLVDYYLVNIFREDTLRDDKCVGVKWKNSEDNEMGCYYIMKE